MSQRYIYISKVRLQILISLQRYVYPMIAPPTAPQLEQDKQAIDESFEKAFSLLDQLAKDTEALKSSEQARTERLDTALTEVETVISEFSNHRFDGAIEGETLAEADEDWFAQIVRGVIGDLRDIDAAVKARLASNWRLERLDATLRALLRSGAWELAHKPEVPREIVIDEYVELAKAFFDEAEAKFVNAALDGVARDVRPKA